MGLLHLTVNETHAILRGLDGLGELNAHLFLKKELFPTPHCPSDSQEFYQLFQESQLHK